MHTNPLITARAAATRFNGQVMTSHEEAMRSEKRLLRFSAVASGLFAAVAIVWGVSAESAVILLDGVYALIGVLLAGLSLRAAALVERGPTPHYPFGREALAPLVVGVQGLVLIGSLGYAVTDALSVIAEGGSQTSFQSALAYSVVSAAFGVFGWQVLSRRGGDSELVAAESAQWFAGVLLSLGMFVGFGAAILLQGSSWAGVVPYIDPIMVLLAAMLIAPTPVRMLAQMYRELLEGAAPADLADPVADVVHRVSAEEELPEPTVRIGKLGRKLYVEVDYLVEESDGWTITDADRIHRVLADRLREPGRLLWINVELHTDPNWDVD